MTSVGAHVSPGDIIAGRYRIEAWVGQGNMARVFHATHLGTGRACALKLVHAHLVERPEVRNLFVQEARVGARIGKHPNIVDVFDAGLDPEHGVPFLAMDLLTGTTLDKYIDEHGPMPPALVRTLWLQLADALEQAHSGGVVHRDLKPSNLFLSYDRKGNAQLRIVDFGIAKVLEEGYQKTATQIGSPAYAAPEQLGEGIRKLAARMGLTISSTISPAADIWALGIITYELLTGAPAGQLWTGTERGAMADLLLAVTTGPTPSAHERASDRAYLLPRGFDAWLDRCLQKNSTDRWPNIEVAVQHFNSLYEARPNDVAMHPLHEATVRLPNPPTIAHSLTTSPKTALLTPEQLAPSVDTSIRPSKQDPVRLDASEPPNAAQTATPRVDATSMDIAGTWANPRRVRSRMLGFSILGAVLLTGIGILLIAMNNSDKPTTPQDVVATQSVTNSISAPTIGSNSITVPTTEAPASTPAPAVSLAMAPPIASLWGTLPNKTSPPSNSTAPVTSPSTSATSPALATTGTLRINSIPPSRVILDGRPMGMTPIVGVSVPPGSHKVVFVHSELGQKVIVVDVQSGETKIAAVKFQ